MNPGQVASAHAQLRGPQQPPPPPVLPPNLISLPQSQQQTNSSNINNIIKTENNIVKQELPGSNDTSNISGGPPGSLQIPNHLETKVKSEVKPELNADTNDA